MGFKKNFWTGFAKNLEYSAKFFAILCALTVLTEHDFMFIIYAIILWVVGELFKVTDKKIKEEGTFDNL